MIIQGEDLPDLDVRRITQDIFGDSLHAKRRESLASAVLGVMASGSLIVNRIGQGLALRSQLSGKHAVKQVDRLLSNELLKMETCFAKTVPFIVSGRKQIKLVMDWTYFDKGKHAVIMISMITDHGRSLPLMWKTVSTKDLRDKMNGYEDELLSELRELLPADCHVTIIADRGFGDIRLYDYLTETLKFHFIIRFRGNIEVADSEGETRKAKAWVGPGGRARTLKNARVTAQGYCVAKVICLQAKGMKEPWCIATSDPETVSSAIIRFYGKRWGIESQFRDTKDIHSGMGLSSTSIRSAQRRDRILLIYCLATILLTLMGAAGEKLGWDRLLKVNTVKRRTLSLFRQGCHY